MNQGPTVPSFLHRMKSSAAIVLARESAGFLTFARGPCSLVSSVTLLVSRCLGGCAWGSCEACVRSKVTRAVQWHGGARGRVWDCGYDRSVAQRRKEVSWSWFLGGTGTFCFHRFLPTALTPFPPLVAAKHCPLPGGPHSGGAACSPFFTSQGPRSPSLLSATHFRSRSLPPKMHSFQHVGHLLSSFSRAERGVYMLWFTQHSFVSISSSYSQPCSRRQEACIPSIVKKNKQFAV